MLSKIVKLGIIGAFALTATAAVARDTASRGSSATGGSIVVAGESMTPVQKQTDPKAYGTSQSESRGGQNKNGAAMTGDSDTQTKVQKDTDPQRNGTSQSESRSGSNKNGQTQ